MQRNHMFPTLYRQRYTLLLALCLLLGCPAVAWSHAHPKQMTPAPDATLEKAPKQVKMLFTEDLEPAFSSLKVTDAQGHSVTAEHSQVDANQPKQMTVPLESLVPGTYTVHWHVVARDGHTTEGTYDFQLQ